MVSAVPGLRETVAVVMKINVTKLLGGYRPDGHYPHRTAIACIIRERHFREGHFRIYSHEGSGIISETTWLLSAGWAPTNRLSIRFPNASHFVALEWMKPDVHEEWQQHIVGINTADGTFWDYLVGSEKLESQVSLFSMTASAVVS